MGDFAGNFVCAVRESKIMKALPVTDESWEYSTFIDLIFEHGSTV